MLQSGQFLKTDVFTHTLIGAPWINFEWLSQIVLIVVQQGLGFWGLFWGKVILGLLAWGVLIVVTRRAGANGFWLWFLAWGGFKILQPRLLERTELTTLIFMSLTVGLLLQKKRYVPWVLFGLTTLWVNLHGGFIYGLGVAVLFSMGAIWARWPKPDIRRLVVCAGAMFLAACLNPYGPVIFSVLFDHLTQLREGLFLIQEWKPTAIHDVPYFWAAFLGAGVLVVRCLIKRQRTHYFWIPAVFVFLVWGSLYFRNAALAVFVVLPFAGAVFGKVKAPKFAWFFCLLPFLLDARVIARPWPQEPVMWNRYPVGAADFIQKSGLQGTLYNPYHWGGFLEWTLGPDRKIFMDGRYLFFPLFKEEVNAVKALTLDTSGNAWRHFLQTHKIEVAVVSYDQGLDIVSPATPFPLVPVNLMFPRDQWALVFWDDAAMVFLKRGTVPYKEYEAIWPYNLEQMAFFLKEKKLNAARVKSEMERHKQEVTISYRRNQIEEAIGKL